MVYSSENEKQLICIFTPVLSFNVVYLDCALLCCDREDSSGGAWGGDPVHQKRKRWRAVSEDEVPKKSASINTQSSPLFSCFSRDT